LATPRGGENVGITATGGDSVGATATRPTIKTAVGGGATKIGSGLDAPPRPAEPPRGRPVESTPPNRRSTHRVTGRRRGTPAAVIKAARVHPARRQPRARRRRRAAGGAAANVPVAWSVKVALRRVVVHIPHVHGGGDSVKRAGGGGTGRRTGRGRKPVQRHPHERKGRVDADGDRARARGHRAACATCAQRAVVGGTLEEGVLHQRQKFVFERLTRTTASRCLAASNSGAPTDSRAALHKAATDRLPGRRQSRRRAGNSVCRGHGCFLRPLRSEVADGRPHKPPVGRACDSAPRRPRRRQPVRGAAVTTKSRVDQVAALNISDRVFTRTIQGELGSGERERPRPHGGLARAARLHGVGPIRGLWWGRGRG